MGTGSGSTAGNIEIFKTRPVPVPISSHAEPRTVSSSFSVLRSSFPGDLADPAKIRPGICKCEIRVPAAKGSIVTKRRETFVCLMYHNVPATAAPYTGLSPSVTSYFVDRETFARQMQMLQGMGATCWGTEALAGFYAGDTLASPPARQPLPVILTFDDGWRESVDTAGPILESHGYQAMLFITTGLIGRPHFLARSHIDRLPRHVFRIGSHGRSHRLLSQLAAYDIHQELAGSRAFLEDAIGCPVEALSVPGGAYDDRVRQIAAEVGYRFVFTSRVQANARGQDARAIGRIAIRQSTSLSAFRRIVLQRLGRERLRQWIAGAPKRLLGDARYQRLRRRLLGVTPEQKDMDNL
jgi:peptidoglycan/xylan/chitin deacetylase (PgdA/CDA1 family)